MDALPGAAQGSSQAQLAARGLWEQSLLAKQAPRFLKDRIDRIAGKPCSHTAGAFVAFNRVATKACAA
ncbi:hypothetical protein AK973_4836 [Pseudomonas brassicacearum]|nr:hypothetical protein AK973_4836 [Pseudomonas brassicacearum]QEO80481.1 hypothetical protein ELZ14_24150 [Pseudomonas brassicacearum]